MNRAEPAPTESTERLEDALRDAGVPSGHIHRTIFEHVFPGYLRALWMCTRSSLLGSPEWRLTEQLRGCRSMAEVEQAVDDYARLAPSRSLSTARIARPIGTIRARAAALWAHSVREPHRRKLASH